MSVIEARKLTKRYGHFEALKAVDFNIAKGQIVGLIGPNGAGKTTLLKAILGLTHFQGELNVLGMQPRKKRVALMNRMCFIADVAILPGWLKVANAIDFVAGVHPRFDRQKALKFLVKTDISMRQRVKELSKGMVVQLHLALVMAIDVEILVLDEPTLGLDILYRNEFYQTIINDYYTEHRTIIITTHQVEEVESILTNLMMIHKGRLLVDCSMDEVAEQFVEVMASPEHVDALQALNPLYRTKEIGREKFIFSGVARATLEPLGELSTPSISEIFVAKVRGAKNVNEA